MLVKAFPLCNSALICIAVLTPICERHNTLVQSIGCNSRRLNTTCHILKAYASAKYRAFGLASRMRWFTLKCTDSIIHLMSGMPLYLLGIRSL